MAVPAPLPILRHNLIRMEKGRRHEKKRPSVHAHFHRISAHLRHGKNTEKKKPRHKHTELFPQENKSVHRQEQIGQNRHALYHDYGVGRRIYKFTEV